MVSLAGQSVRVVDAEGLTIDEFAGNVATKSDRLSIAYVRVKAGTWYPWMTLHYDEWLCVVEGHMTVETTDSKVEVPKGSTAFIEKGTRFHPSFAVDTEYVPVCSPAFRPDRCIREDTTDEGHAVAAKLGDLHSTSAPGGGLTEPLPEMLYHMTTVAEWEAAKSSGGAYYPKTYEEDGFYTHATGVPSRLLTTANHFYQDVPGDWVCVSFSRTSLRKAGIHVRDEKAMPVGNKDVSSKWSSWICPHVIGGIPIAVVEKEYRMLREGTKFVSIEGLAASEDADV